MSWAIAQYDALWQSLQTRARTYNRPKGLDAAVARVVLRARHVRYGVRQWQQMAGRIDALDSEHAALTDAQLDQRIMALREMYRRHRADDRHRIGAMATLRELASRVLGQKPYLVQLMGCLAICHGQIVQMLTGEGKTLSAALAATLMAWSRPSVHVVTANDYLAGRDAQWMGPFYCRAGLTVAVILPVMRPRQRMAAYRCSVVYATPKELVGDWLRDQLRLGPVRQAVTHRLTTGPHGIPATHVRIPGLHAAIVDEADAALIAQATTPLVVSTARQRNRDGSVYHRAAELAGQLQQSFHYELDSRGESVVLREAGREHLATMVAKGDRGEWRLARRRRELVEQALAAQHVCHRGEQYDLMDGRVVLIDRHTGRFLPDRHWPRGLQQAVEVKEGLPISGESKPLATISLQRFFRLYPRLAGMTGTVVRARREFEQVYGCPVRIIRPHVPIIRTIWPTRIFATAQEKWAAVVESVCQIHAEGRPLLVGTRSVGASHHLSELLWRRQVEHHVLNAIHHESEAEVIAEAGRCGSVTIATNMAGRGVDIILGPSAAQRSGLHVILTECHDDARSDAQLISRAGRRGDPGSAQIFVSFEDPLVAGHGQGVINWARLCSWIPAGRMRSSLERRLVAWAQRCAESGAFRTRMAILRRDDWLDQMVPRG